MKGWPTYYLTINGKGIRCYATSPTIKNNIIKEYGTIIGEQEASPTIFHNTITHGAGISGCDGLISHNIIAHNWYARGGGLRECHGEIINNIVAWNSANEAGGFFLCFGVIANNTIVHNSSSAYGGAISICETVINNIIAYNKADPGSGGGIYGQCNNQYNCFYMNTGGHFAGGAFPGIGDFASAPLFADLDSGDYHLKSSSGRWKPNSQSWIQDDVNSPCIDAGDPNDSIGNEPNPNGGRINIGAYGGTAQASKSPSGIVEPVCANPPPMDTNNDCKIDFTDFAEFASQWMDCGLDPPEACWQ